MTSSVEAEGPAHRARQLVDAPVDHEDGGMLLRELHDLGAFSGTLVPTDRVHETTLPGGRLVTTTHSGPYGTIGDAWERAATWMDEHELKATGAPWECYLTGPDEPGPPITEIYWPLD